MTDIMDLNKNLRICKLIDCYGGLLKESQLQLLKNYYFDDCSLSELADVYNISRQALNEKINNSIGKLEMYEQKLNKLEIAQIVEQMTKENLEKSKQLLKDLM